MVESGVDRSLWLIATVLSGLVWSVGEQEVEDLLKWQRVAANGGTALDSGNWR
jgi:hypothetical protein